MVLKWKQLLYLIGPTILLFVVLLALSEAKPHLRPGRQYLYFLP